MLSGRYNESMSDESNAPWNPVSWHVKYRETYTNLIFWSAVCGFVGSIFLYFFGLPPEVHSDGHINLVLEQIDESQIRLAAKYAWYGRLGLGLIALSFLLQIVDIMRHSGNQIQQVHTISTKSE